MLKMKIENDMVNIESQCKTQRTAFSAMYMYITTTRVGL